MYDSQNGLENYKLQLILCKIGYVQVFVCRK